MSRVFSTHFFSTQLTNHRILQSLNLPSSLEALERPVGLPPSLLRKAEEIRLEQGPTKVDVYIDDVQRLSRHVLAILDEVSSFSLQVWIILSLDGFLGYGYPRQ